MAHLQSSLAQKHPPIFHIIRAAHPVYCQIFRKGFRSTTFTLWNKDYNFKVSLFELLGIGIQPAITHPKGSAMFNIRFQSFEWALREARASAEGG
jgi:hypothetical protein